MWPYSFLLPSCAGSAHHTWRGILIVVIVPKPACLVRTCNCLPATSLFLVLPYVPAQLLLPRPSLVFPWILEEEGWRQTFLWRRKEEKKEGGRWEEWRDRGTGDRGSGTGIN